MNPVDVRRISGQDKAASNDSKCATAQAPPPLRPGPCGYAATTEAPEWFLLNASPASAARILGMVGDRGAEFCSRTLGSIRRGPKAGGGAPGRQQIAQTVKSPSPTHLLIKRVGAFGWYCWSFNGVCNQTCSKVSKGEPGRIGLLRVRVQACVTPATCQVSARGAV